MHEVRVLLVDDQAIVAEALRQTLADEADIILEYCADPDLAEKAIREFQPTVVLQDLVLPGTSGIEVTKRLRLLPEFLDLPVILLSTTDDAQTKYQAFMAGANDYVVKFPEKYELLGRLRYHSRAYRNAVEKIKAERLLSQRSRLESLGNLSAGIAHEINTPLQYISSNLNFLNSSFQAIERTLEAFATLVPSTEFKKIDEQEDLAFIREELGQAVDQSLEGARQITRIVRAMNVFAHPGSDEHAPIDLNMLIEDVITVTRNQWREVATVEIKLPQSPLQVFGSRGGISQVLLNLVINAAQALQDRRGEKGAPGRIVVSASEEAGFAVINVTDNAGGIPEHVRERIFEPFFTTKEVGKGSGQGLAIARSIVVDVHKGKLEFSVEEGVGTTFTITLPSFQANNFVLEELAV